jgi:hypothetical protein
VSRNQRAGSGCLIAFGLPFAAIGIYTGVAAYRLYTYSGWTRPAVLLGWAAFAFSFVGLGVMVMALSGRKPAITDDELRRRNPEQPWMWNAEWVSRRISDQSSAGTSLLWGFAMLWNAIASTVLVAIPSEIRKGNPLAWIGLVFPLAGVVLLISAVRLTLRALRFRDSKLILDTMPVPIGGTLRGTVEVPHTLTSVTGVMIRLVGLSRRSSGSETADSIVCHEERELDPGLLRQSASGTIIPIEIAVPADAPATETTGENENVFWRLSVDAEVPGIDYTATFDVPVFKTAFSDFRPHGSPAPPITAPVEPKSFVQRQTPEGRELYFPRFRAPSPAFVSLLFTLVWLGAIAFMVVIRVPIAIPIICGLIAILLIFSTLDLFFESRTILLGPRDVTVTRRMLSKTEKVIAYADIESAKAVLIGTGQGARPYYRVDIRTKAGKRIKAAKNIHSKREADWVASRIKARS